MKSKKLKELNSSSGFLDANDLHNLQFLLSVSDESYKKWQDQANNDDLDYAIEILLEYNLMIQEALCDEPFAQANKLLQSIKK